jgi:hypothetical protein
MSMAMDSGIADGIPLERRLATWLGRMAFASALVPFGFLMGVYAEWLACWWIIGHPPIPYADDPKYIDSPIVLAWATVVLFLLSLPAAFFSLWCMAYQAYLDFPKTLLGGIRSFIPVLLLLLSYAVLHLDPSRVFDWYFD